MIGNWLFLFFKRRLGGLPSCIKDITIAWWKNLTQNSQGYVEESIGTRVDTVYYGQYLNSGSGVNGLLYFDGVDDYVDVGTVDVTGSKTITFNLYVESTITGLIPVCSFNGDGSDDIFVVDILGTTLRCYCKGSVAGTNGRRTYDISGLLDTLLTVEITKTTEQCLSITINSVENSAAQSLSTSTGNIHGYIGTNRLLSAFANYLYIWNFNINDEHQWQGQPSGNLNSAWVDTIGSNNGTVNGSPTTYDLPLGGTPSVINFYRNTGTFSYINPVDGSLVSGVTIPANGLYTIPATGICEINTSDGSYYPVCEREGIVIHDVKENSVHISVSSPDWQETLYGSDYLNQCGFLDKATSDTLGYDWETVVHSTTITLNNDTLIPLSKWHYEDLLDSNGDLVLDSNGEQIQIKVND